MTCAVVALVYLTDINPSSAEDNEVDQLAIKFIRASLDYSSLTNMLIQGENFQ